MVYLETLEVGLHFVGVVNGCVVQNHHRAWWEAPSEVGKEESEVIGVGPTLALGVGEDNTTPSSYAVAVQGAAIGFTLAHMSVKFFKRSTLPSNQSTTNRGTR